jgi:sec-independent protein translocase protein TatB
VFDFGFSELVLIGLIALIVLGPKRLPEAARSAGQWIGKLRRFVENVKRDIDAEIKDEDLAAFRQMHTELNETRNLLQKSAAETFSNFSGAMHEVTQAGEPGSADDAPTPPSSVAAQVIPPAVSARKPTAKAPSKTPRKTVAKVISKKVVTKKVTTRINRVSHGGIKKTRAR